MTTIRTTRSDAPEALTTDATDPVPGPVPTKTAQVKAAAPPVESPNQLEPWRANDADQGPVGRALESAYRTQLERIPPGAKGELEAELKLRLPAAVEANGRFSVARDDDGSYLVTYRNRALVGVDAKAPQAGPSGSLMGGAEGAVTLRLGSAAEAADALAAISQSAARHHSAMGPVVALAQGVGVLDRNAPERTAAALRRVSELEVSAVGRFKAEADAVFAKAGVTAQGAGTLRVDLENEKLIFEVSGKVTGEAAARLKVGPIIAEHAQFRGELEGSVLLRTEMKVSAEDLRKVARGETRAGDLARAGRFEATLQQQVKGDVLGAHFTLTRTVRGFPELLDPFAPQAEWAASAGVRTGGSIAFDQDLGVAAVKLKVTVEEPLFQTQTRYFGLTAGLRAVADASAEHAVAVQGVAARQALSSANRR